jgi:hypothetical protein
MSYGEEQKRKNARQNKIILIILMLILTNFTTFLMAAKLWQLKLISIVDNCEITKVQHKKIIALNPEIPTQKVFIQRYEQQ